MTLRNVSFPGSSRVGSDGSSVVHVSVTLDLREGRPHGWVSDVEFVLGDRSRRKNSVPERYTNVVVVNLSGHG